MLEVGFRGGTLPDFRQLNLIAKTAEQMANVTVSSHLKGISDNGKTFLTNTVYHTQLKDRLMLVAVYISESSLTIPAYDYPILTAVHDYNNNNLLAQFTLISNVAEEFIKDIYGFSIKVTMIKTSYSVSSGAIDKRLKIGFSPIGTSKDFDATYFNSMFIMQVNSGLVAIDKLLDGGLSDYTWINKIKEAFRLNQSYNIAIFDVSGSKTYSDYMIKYFNYYNDLYEVGTISGETTDIGFLVANSDIDGDSLYRYFLESFVTSGALFDFSRFHQTQLNFNKIDLANHKNIIKNGLYLTTTDTFNLAINSISDDALNSYDLIMLKRDFANRLQGKLFYPVVGTSLITTGNAEVPVNLNITMNNNIDDEDFAYELELINGYKLKFAIR